MKKTSHTFHFPLSLGEGAGVRLYFQQALYHLRENPVISWISVLGTALSICMIMVIVITLRVRIADCEPEVNRSRSLYVPNMSYRAKGDTSGSSANSSMSVQTGRECFKALTTAEAVTLTSNPGKVRVSLPAGAKMTADMVQTDEAFWQVFRFRFLDGKPFTAADLRSGLPRAVITASVARRLFGRTDVSGQHIELNHVDFQVCGVVADVSMLATDAYAQVWIPYTAGDAEANSWGYNLMGPMRAVILARSRADFPAIREECERLRQKYNDAQEGVEVFYRGQPDTQFAHLYRSWSQEPDVQGVVLRYVAVMLILLIVPAINLSSMTLSRMRKRMAEIGVRKAFGATANELMRQVFLENLLLTCLAGLLGLFLSYAATFVLNGFLFGNSTNAYLSGETSLTASELLSPWIFLAAFGFCLLMNLLSAGIPAWRASRMNIVEAINGKAH
ncbi:ABC transporter permease [Bacteroides sp. ET489]|uniref:ABC transporter permease n=1 Tax=Bacteroides sp. ET489 TaxID=3057126 RepID=UPI0026735F67|nr:FtsX-like permease family protein [Bacteroides sp. ET489]MDO3389072.1 ABC transporter permease [Bacteroides sp. ET489]